MKLQSLVTAALIATSPAFAVLKPLDTASISSLSDKADSLLDEICFLKKDETLSFGRTMAHHLSRFTTFLYQELTGLSLMEEEANSIDKNSQKTEGTSRRLDDSQNDVADLKKRQVRYIHSTLSDLENGRDS
jgi:ABC-type multidrug transport system ATPase subunit